ncbi:MAG: DUF1638 domain-containing protein [Sphingomonadales bacterium]|nr:DUF1638 domain-containing protein [Sphingomonadales bacterium]
MRQGRCLVLACGALAKEIVALKAQLGLSDEDVALQCLPAELHNRPREIAPRVDEVLTARRHEFDRVLIGYGECGTGGALDEVLARHDAQRLPHAHCYEFFAGTTQFAEIVEAELGSFFLTDYLVRNFERLVITGLGLDRFPHLRDSYFGNYRDLVYLAQLDDEALQKQARAAAERLGLNYVYRKVGYGDLAAALAEIGHV